MGEISATIHQFCRGKARGDEILGEDLFNKFLTKGLIEDQSKEDLIEAINENLRMEVANYIREHTEMHRMVLSSTDDYETVQEYCSAIEQGELEGGDLELTALSDLFNIIICVIDLTKITSDNCLLPSYYGENNPLATECVYIYYNGEDHFDPLYMINIENSNEIETIFNPNDQKMNDLLKKCIKEKMKCNRKIKLGLKIGACVNEVSKPTDGSNEIERTSNSIPMNKPTKRKEIKHDDIAMSSNNDKPLPIEISDEYYVPKKRIKVAECAASEMSTFYKNNSETIITKERIQVQDICGESDPPVNQQQIADISMALNDESQEEKIEAEEEPNNKLESSIQNNDKLSYDSESTKRKF